jgi:hypothetical protein
VTPEEAANLGLGRIVGLENHIRLYRNGRDLTQQPRGVMVLDFFGLKSDEFRLRYPEAYQWVRERVKPERDQSNRQSYRDSWWIFGEPRRDFRPALVGLNRYIATIVTSKHRFFVFLDRDVLPDDALIAIATASACLLGTLSSRIRVAWSLVTGSRLGVGNDPRYIKTRCFESFPFPDTTEQQRALIGDLAEQIDVRRKKRQELYPTLKLTDIYNVLEKLRTREELTDKDKQIH